MKLIENGLVVTMDPERKIYDRGDLVIRDGRITYVGPAGSAPFGRNEYSEIMDASSQIGHARSGQCSQPLPISLE